MESCIRAFQPGDTEAAVNIWLSASKAAHPFLSDEFMAGEMVRIRDRHLPDAESWVFERDGEILGFIAMIGGTVGGLFVEPAAQRMGIGSMLMDHAAKRGGTLALDVFKSNRIGRSFYEKYGFGVAHEHVHEETGQSLLHMRYRVPGARP